MQRHNGICGGLIGLATGIYCLSTPRKALIAVSRLSRRVPTLQFAVCLRILAAARLPATNDAMFDALEFETGVEGKFARVATIEIFATRQEVLEPPAERAASSGGWTRAPVHRSHAKCGKLTVVNHADRDQEFKEWCILMRIDIAIAVWCLTHSFLCAQPFLNVLRNMRGRAIRRRLM